MEDRLIVQVHKVQNFVDNGSLNPCFNGRQTDSIGIGAEIIEHSAVLILVLMEDRLIVYDNVRIFGYVISLNPCFNGRQTDSWHRR